MFLEFAIGFGILLGYFAICLAGALFLRRFVTMPREVFRKVLHLILLGSIFVLTYGFKTWWVSTIAVIVFIAIFFPVLAFAERIPGYSKLLIERKRGEIKQSLILAFSMFAILISICWGWLGLKFLVIASVLAWGLGDLAAALVGKEFGQKYIEGKLVEGRKTLEGTLAMFGVSFVTVLVVLLAYGGPLEGLEYVLIATLTAAGTTIVELYTKNGMDTITCPFTAAAIMTPLVLLLGV